MNGENPKIQPPSGTPDDAGSQALAEALRSSFGLVKLVMVVLVVVFLGSNFFIVDSRERAIVLRLGKPLGQGERVLLGPGLHFALPYPIDVVTKIKITESQSLNSTVGWYAGSREQELAGTEPPPTPTLNPAIDGYALTADGNIVHTRATLRYRITEPVRFALDFLAATNALQNALDNALIGTAARFTVDDILTRDRAGFQDAVTRRLTRSVEAQNLGVTVDQCNVESRAPRFLTEVFNRVLQTEVERNKKLDEARSYENRVLSGAGAEAANRINLAESDRRRQVESVKAESERFNDLLPQYQGAPDLYVQKVLNEVVARVMTNAQDKIFLASRPDGQTRELRLLLNREPPKAKTEPPPAR
jgi:membrane protease subunit HflK